VEIYSYNSARQLEKQKHSSDLVVAGGGLAGVCAAISAAREGLKVILVQDRPVLGGNASSEVRLWALGATSHMGNNNRFAREGGVMGEILEENLYRNKEGNPVIFDMILLDMVYRESNISLYLNSAIFNVEADSGTKSSRIQSISAFNAINETLYTFEAPLYCDCTGDGVVGHLAGASYRIGSEDAEEFDEKMSPDDSFGKKLGHSVYFYTKQVDAPVDFAPPAFALQDITEIPRYKRLSSNLNGCDLWWLEWGGRLDTIHDSEAIKWELWKIVWGVWDHIKNSGEFNDVDTMTLEWVGVIPGKRESRRFIGDYMLTQKDIIEQHDHYDAVSYGGWSIDLHPADGVYSKHDGCRQFHSKGTYTIPMRTMYSREVENLFLGGRTLSASHVAFGSTRVMCTTGQNGQVLGEAAALCLRNALTPRQLASEVHIKSLQQHLMQKGFYIPRQKAVLQLTGEYSASSTMELTDSNLDGQMRQLDENCALMLPMLAGESLPSIELELDVKYDTCLQFALLTSDKAYNHTPENTVAEKELELQPGRQKVILEFSYQADCTRMVFVNLKANPDIDVLTTDGELPGILTLYNTVNPKVAKRSRQVAEGDWGVDEFDFWLPKRRPEKRLPVFKLSSPLQAYNSEYAGNGELRPSNHSHAWVPDHDDSKPWLSLQLERETELGQVTLVFDNDFDHAMETAQWGHTEKVAPNCIRDYDVYLDDELYCSKRDNHHSVNQIKLDSGIKATNIRIEVLDTHGDVPCIYALHVYAR